MIAGVYHEVSRVCELFIDVKRSSSAVCTVSTVSTRSDRFVRLDGRHGYSVRSSPRTKSRNSTNMLSKHRHPNYE